MADIATTGYDGKARSTTPLLNRRSDLTMTENKVLGGQAEYIAVTTDGSGAFSVKLPPVSIGKGKRYTIDFVSKTTDNVTVIDAGDSSKAISDAITVEAGFAIYESNGLFWYLVAQKLT